MVAQPQGRPVEVRPVPVPVGAARHAAGKLRRPAQVAARGAARPGRAHPLQRRQDRLRGVPHGRQLRSRHRQVGTGQLAHHLDADDPDRVQHHRVGQLRDAAPVDHLGRNHQVAGPQPQLTLVRGLGHPCHARQMAGRAGRARPEEGHALLGRRGAAVVGREPGRLRGRSQL